MRLFKLYHLFWLFLPVITARPLSAQSQKLYLRNEIIIAPPQLADLPDKNISRKSFFDPIGKLVILQFNSIPSKDIVRQLNQAGIDILDYIPDNAYTTVLKGEPDINWLKSLNVKSIIELTPVQKIQPQLLSGKLPSYMLKVPGKMDVLVSYPRSLLNQEVTAYLNKNHFEIISEDLIDYQFLEIRLDTTRLKELAALPWIQYIEEIASPIETLNDKSIAATRANVLSSERGLSNKLDGKGVVIGIGDLGHTSEHIDMTGRVVSNAIRYVDRHGVHVTGTAAGAGAGDEKYTGYAPGANIIMRVTTDIWKQAPALVRDFGMVLTNNSYGSEYGGAGCPGFGRYSGHSQILDEQAHKMPYLQHVFAAGNSGNAGACNGFSTGFGNVQGDYASAKNVLSIGQTALSGLIAAGSSKGPVQDGRIKPELVAPGSSIYSSIPDNKYGTSTGTSMAAPAITGGAALLYQQYRQLHHQQNPKSALVKALLCNGATDKGLAGPDFSYGFGMMNLLRSSEMLRKGFYFSGILENQDVKEFQIQIPAGTSLAKIMLYWNDAGASTMAGGKALVNNLDLKVKTPQGAEVFPLSPNLTDIHAPAIAQIDNINNVEQVVLENPASGNYIFQVTGSAIPVGPQEFFVVYDVIEESVVLTYPSGSERLTSGDVININWDSYGNSASTFAVSYSLNNGATWVIINPAVSAGTNRLSWTVPEATTVSAKIRLIQNETGIIKESNTFAILGVPVISMAPVQCPGYAVINWSAVNEAVDYEVMRLRDGEMQPVATTKDLTYTFGGLSGDTTYYFSVRARINGIPGRRAIAVGREPGNGSCEGTISDNDLGIVSVISPIKSGREFTTSSLPANQPVTIKIRNFDDQPIKKPFELGYSIGGPDAPVHWETIDTEIGSQITLDHTFSKTADLHAAGTYIFHFYVKIEGDVMLANNTKTTVISQMRNTRVSLPYLEDFERMTVQSLLSDKIGLENAERYDFVSHNNVGRLRTSIEPGHAYSGSKALVFDSDSWSTTPYFTTLVGTYNLDGLNVESEEILLKFRFRQYGYNEHYGDVGVYIRGSDTDSWIFVSDYRDRMYLKYDNNYYLKTVEVSNLLRKNSQHFSTSFQVMWRQKAYYPAQSDGLSIDDIELVKTSSDIELVEVMPLSIPLCSENYHQLSVRIRNLGTDDCFQIPVQVLVDGKNVYSHHIPVVRAGRDTLFTFEATTNLQQGGDHIIRASVDKSFDISLDNNVAELKINTPPPITKFPYFEDFENGSGGWQTFGENSAWQFGQPNSSKVKGAASGKNAWKTNLTGPYKNDGVSYLYSPCFYLGESGRRNIMLSFSTSLDLDPCDNGGCDVAYVEYNTTRGWATLGHSGWNTNWYTTNVGKDFAWNSQDYTRWHVATTLAIPSTGSYIRFRFVLKGNSSTQREGFAIDDVHLYDSDYIYNFTGQLNGQQLNQGSSSKDNLDGNEWVRFEAENALIAAIKPNNQKLGNVAVSAFKNNLPTPVSSNEYYLPRNFTIHTSQQTYPESVGVRLFFKDKEIEGLIAAPDNALINRPNSVSDLSLTKYSGTNEDGTLGNNGESSWNHIPKQTIRMVPYMDGYYAEFETKSFSEFWMAKNFVGPAQSLPVTIVSFLAKRQVDELEKKESVLLSWRTSEEKDFSHFDVEIAGNKEDVQKMQFVKIGRVSGNTITRAYSFIDTSFFEATTRYYRLKMEDKDGSFRYSGIRAVTLNDQTEWKMFPNPVKEKMSVRFEGPSDKLVRCSILDVNGRILLTENFIADGTIQQKDIGLTAINFVPGVYVFKITTSDQEKVFKFIKE